MPQRPAFWWPLRRHAEPGPRRNTRLEFFARTGPPGAYVYYPGGGATEPGTGHVVEADPGLHVTLPWPLGYEAWPTVHAYCEALKAAMEAAPDLPPGFALAWSVSDEGLLSLAVSADPGVENPCVRFRWNDHPATAALLGFDPGADAHAAVKTAARGHEGGFYLAADPAACVEQATGPALRDLVVTEAASLYGAVVGTALGGRLVRGYTFAMLNPDQTDRLADLWSHAADGGAFALHPEGVSYSPAPLAHLLDAETRRAWSPEYPYPGLPRARVRLGLVSRSLP